MNKSELLMKAVDESAATTYTLTRLAKDNSDSMNGVLDNLLRDIQIHDSGATASVNDNGDVEVSTRLGSSLEYIFKKYNLDYANTAN